MDEAYVQEATGDDPRNAKEIEVAFQAIGAAPGLRSCSQLQELTLMNARLHRIPPEVQHVRGTLCRLSLQCNDITAIDHLGGMVHLHSLFLQHNLIEAAYGLTGCPNLQRLWLCANRVRNLGGLTCLSELRELWLQDNPISAVGELRELTNLQVLSLAATHIDSFAALEPLRALPYLTELALDDAFFGAAPIADLDEYTPSLVHRMPGLQARAARPTPQAQPATLSPPARRCSTGAS
jgi:Leucine-rich repeat (LRR) protein